MIVMRERERGWGLFALLLLYYMYCFNVFLSFNVACVYCLFLIVPVICNCGISWSHSLTFQDQNCIKLRQTS